ncbi:hypothetical protein [Dactylosporangium sp. CA-233914]|uniref:hypothetical protein n=1 Tax=Dactylosporangium sp. CA-233914 TaxID=3239934 RepID=UPI003D8EDC8A
MDTHDRDARARVEEELGHGNYGPGAFDEVTDPSDPAREVLRRGAGEPTGAVARDPADAAAEAEILRNGGPTTSEGLRTTTGSHAGPGGPGSARHHRRVQPGAAPATTGDATTGGMTSPAAAETGELSDR